MSESVASEVVSAMAGGMVSASALYPLEVLKTRMQAEAHPTPSADTSTSSGGAEEGKEAASRKMDTLATPTSPDAPSASDALREDYRHAAEAGVVSYAALMLEREGRSAFYNGVATKTIQTSAEAALYFLGYTALKNGCAGWANGGANGGAKPKPLGPLVNLLVGCVAEWAHLPVTLPLDCLTTAIQTDGRNRGAFVLLGQMLSQKGIGGFYRGIEAYSVLCLKPAIQYTIFDQVKKAVLTARAARTQRGVRGSTHSHQHESLTAAEAFVLGMVSLTISTLIVYPYLRAKVLLQIADNTNNDNNGNKETKPPTSIPAMIAEQLSHGGLGAIYQGIGPQLLRGVLSAALMMMVKEKIGVAVRAVMEGKGEGRRHR